MKILYTSPILEHPAAGGPQLRIENSIKALSKIAKVVVVSRNSLKHIGGDQAVDFYASYADSFSFSPSISGLSSNRYLSKVQRVVRNIFSSSLLKDAQYIVNIAEENDIKIIWFGYGNISYDLIKEVKARDPELKLVCDTDSVWSRFILRELPYEKDNERAVKIKLEGGKKEKEEEEWVNVCDVTTAVSEVDLEYYLNLAEDKSKVMLFSNVIDMDTYKVKPKKEVDFKNPCVYLAGTFGPKSAMDKAARWFIEDIYPLVKKDIPNIHFYIVGKGSKETLADIRDESISIMGKMRSVLPYLCYSDVSLVPLQFESGTRFKIMEAAACNIPIVSTTLGAEGLATEHGKNILIADEPDDFANAIVKLINDKGFAKHISNHCYQLISQTNSIDVLKSEAEQILRKLNALSKA